MVLSDWSAWWKGGPGDLDNKDASGGARGYNATDAKNNWPPPFFLYPPRKVTHMRKSLIVLMSILLAGCVDDSASYLIDGRDHVLTVRRQQAYFWKDQVAVTMLAARLPDCQRLHELADFGPADNLKIDVFASDDNTFNVRMGNRLWQLETNSCEGMTELQDDPNADVGTAVGSFTVKNGKLVFTPVPAK